MGAHLNKQKKHAKQKQNKTKQNKTTFSHPATRPPGHSPLPQQGIDSLPRKFAHHPQDHAAYIWCSE
jgi:hypothetical protein